MTEYWRLGPPSWELTSRRTEGRPSVKQASTIYRTVLPSPELIERDAAEGSILSMRFALFGVWQEIHSPVEGHFMEMVQRGAFAKSIRESLRNIRALLSHGKDVALGETVLGKIESIEEAPDAAVARVALFPNVPGLLVDGLRAGVYGASFRGRPIKSKTDYHPGRSAHNHRGFPRSRARRSRSAISGRRRSPRTRGRRRRSRLPPMRLCRHVHAGVNSPRSSVPPGTSATSTIQVGSSGTERTSAVVARSRSARPTIRDLVEDDALVIVIEGFRPRMGRMYTKGEFHRLSDAIVQQFPAYFAVVIPAETVLREIGR